MPNKKPVKNAESDKELSAMEEDDEIPPLSAEPAPDIEESLVPLGEEPILEELKTLGYTDEGPGTPDDGDQPSTEPNTRHKAV